MCTYDYVHAPIILRVLIGFMRQQLHPLCEGITGWVTHNGFSAWVGEHSEVFFNNQQRC